MRRRWVMVALGAFAGLSFYRLLTITEHDLPGPRPPFPRSAKNSAALLATPAHAGPLAGKSYSVQMSSTQYSSGLGEYLLPPLQNGMSTSGHRPQNGPGADMG